MKIDKDLNKVLGDTKARLAALDFTEENSALDALQEQKKEHQDAIGDIDKQLLDIGRQISSQRDDDGEELADAVLSGEGVAVAEAVAPSIETLKERRDALSKAKRALDRRQQAIGVEERELRDQAKAKLNAALKPLVTTLHELQKKAAQEMVDIHAAINALDFAGSGFTKERFVSRNSIEDGPMGQDKLLLGGRHLDVPEAISDLLTSVQGKTPLINGNALMRVARW